MPDDKEFLRKIADQQEQLSQEQLANLGSRLFEAGKRADQQLTLWALFVAITPLCLFGAVDAATIGGLRLDPLVAGAVSFLLASAFYYRVALSTYAIGVWRDALKETRRNRFRLLHLNLPAMAEQQGLPNQSLEEVVFDTYVAEYPSFLACGATLKLAVAGNPKLPSRYNYWVRNATIAFFGASPYLLASCLLFAANFNWWAVGTVAVGLLLSLSGNFLTMADQPAIAEGT